VWALHEGSLGGRDFGIKKGKGPLSHLGNVLSTLRREGGRARLQALKREELIAVVGGRKRTVKKKGGVGRKSFGFSKGHGLRRLQGEVRREERGKKKAQ